MDEKKVTWVELFFDLVFVFAVTRTSELLQDDHTPLGLLRALVVFVPVYWVWVGTSVHANMHDIEDAPARLGILATALCGMILAICLPGAYEAHGLAFGLAYWAARLVLLVSIIGRPHGYAFTTFRVGAFVTGPLLALGGLLDAWRLPLWALAALIDLGVPWLVRGRLRDAPFTPGHLVERFGTFIIIALGETVVATGAAAAEHELTPRRIGVLAAAFVVCAGLWWVYFAFSADAIADAVEGADARIDLIRPVLSYGHLAFIAGIIGVAAAIGRAVAEPGQPLASDAALLLYGGAALYLGAFLFTRWRMYRTFGVQRLVAALACLALIPPAGLWPAAVGVALLAAEMVALNAFEAWRAPSTCAAR